MLCCVSGFDLLYCVSGCDLLCCVSGCAMLCCVSGCAPLCCVSGCGLLCCMSVCVMLCCVLGCVLFILSVAIIADQNHSKWFHHSWLFGQVDIADKVGQHDAGCFGWSLSGQGGSLCARRMLLRQYLLISLPQVRPQ